MSWQVRRLFAKGIVTVSCNNGALAQLPNQRADEITIVHPLADGLYTPRLSQITTFTTSATALTYTQLPSIAGADQVVIFNPSAVIVNLGNSAAPGSSIMTIPAGGSLTIPLPLTRNVAYLFAAIATGTTAAVLGIAVYSVPNLTISDGISQMAIPSQGPLILPCQFNANEYSVGVSNSPVFTPVGFAVVWKQFWQT